MNFMTLLHSILRSLCRSPQAEFDFVSLNHLKAVHSFFTVITNHCLFYITWEQRVRHRLARVFLQSSGDDISVLKKQIISAYFCLLSFNQVSVQVTPLCRWMPRRITCGEKPWQIPCWIPTAVTSSLLLGCKLIAVLCPCTRWDHRSCSYYNLLSWALLSRKVTVKHPVYLGAPALICNMVAVGSHCQCWLLSQEVLIFLLSPADSQPLQAWGLSWFVCTAFSIQKDHNFTKPCDFNQADVRHSVTVQYYS